MTNQSANQSIAMVLEDHGHLLYVRILDAGKTEPHDACIGGDVQQYLQRWHNATLVDTATFMKEGMERRRQRILAAIETTLDPDRDAYIRVLLPGATGVKVLPSRGVQDYDEAVELVMASYPDARIVEPHELNEEVDRRQPLDEA